MIVVEIREIMQINYSQNRFLILTTNDILGRIIVVGSCFVHCRMFNRIFGLYPLDAPSRQPKMCLDIARFCTPSLEWGIQIYPLRITVKEKSLVWYMVLSLLQEAGHIHSQVLRDDLCMDYIMRGSCYSSAW